MLRKTLLAASLATVMFASPVMAQDAAPAEDQVLATVNGEEILESEVRATQQGLPQQYRQLPFEMLKPMLVDREINQRLLMLAGQDAGLADDEEVKNQLAALERRLVAETYLERAIAEKVTDDAIKAHYDEFIKTNEPEPQVHARHILLENEDDAKAVIAELDDGADFVELAKEKSTGPSGPNGGDLGFFNKGDMVAPFAEAAFAMEPGTYSKEPVQTQFGWHVILVEEKKDGVQPTLEEIRQQMEAEVTQQAVQDLIEELRSDAEVVNNTETPATDDSAETPKN
ncbi:MULTISPECIES: peptidylprolyl isomerase [Thalassospira]|jgi:peptidyl-prolyl cis-trans isomerase C|uniref:Parvulin-like PPIase n=2 Tax=Thalassospira xiamenensis TaxID=220697 RepID=A0ABR5Y117_9PROT|nr:MULTISPECIES: peptidylprolyl isomerase [Thalassospira]AJD53709.1 PpiC-type peptidyl-prolyl cis-trans isomerase [Thalassospira xiamenensis M-5 = DSM 17429]KZD03309.1 peptidylprolyl isomerase [Thalassospira xiamenensis]KZD07707.1 peptidylprolyl isomerase [Thalassospira xiamenensis]MAB32895.1 peptidylprolyl isomerase [Thalassospira sp.]MCD1592886.1 peptidylprolyl isomerase [Thalassospira xiamenensis]|tara:strand:+ start:4629 stop:5483 length:855 start_codon:yes stop_codon:yes gene_type:complete